MARPERVYVDMDGVLCCYTRGVLRLFGVADSLAHEVRGWGGIPDVINAGRRAYREVSHRDIETAVRDAGHQFWAELPVLESGLHLIGVLEENEIDYMLLTTPAGGESAMGKFQWVTRHLPHMADKIILTPQKWQCAGEGRLLVDDKAQNCTEWVEAGGEALLWPAPHNLAAPLCASARYAEEVLEVEMAEVFCRSLPQALRL